MRLAGCSAESAREAKNGSKSLISYSDLIGSRFLINSKVLKTALIFLILLCLIPSASAKDYTLDRATANITISPDGLVHVEESISYEFEGNYNEVFRVLNVAPGESIQNISGHCSDETCTFSVKQTSEGYELIGRLPTPTPEKVTFFISYDHYGAVKVHRDVSEFHYKLWGEEWKKPLGSLRGSIKLPVKDETELQYWIHPTAYTKQVNSEKGVINLETNEIPSYHWYEIRAVFPRVESPNASIVQIDNEEGLAQIRAIEGEYKKKGFILNNLYSFTQLFALLALLFPFFIYFKYGREPKINYDAIYEREPPTDSRPAVVNAIMQGKRGMPTMDGFTATVMDLAYRDYISLRTVKSEESSLLGLIKSESEDIIIEIVDNLTHSGTEDTYLQAGGKIRELDDFEKDVFDLLKSHVYEGKISWSELKKELGKGTDFYEFITAWNKKVKEHTAFEKLFKAAGNTYMIIFSLAIILMSFVYLVVFTSYFPSYEFPLASKLNMLIVYFLIYGVVILIFSGIFEKVLGRWTPEGRLYYKRWGNFKKYLTDFSALKEHPPESIKIWDSYLVYATSLGVAKEVLHNMSLVVPAEQLQGSNFYPIHHSYAQFGSGFGSAYASSAPSGSGGGGVGGVGGGSGGGGGGAR